LELVRELDICPSSSDPAKPTTFVRINDPILTPMLSPADHLNLATVEGMKGMGDTNFLV
jgi:hypothetical protein